MRLPSLDEADSAQYTVNMFQPELFKDLQPGQKPKQFQLSSFPGRFLRLRVAYEDAVFTLLGLVLVVLAGFCLGVERGKHLGPQPEVLQTAGIATARENKPAPDPIRLKEPATALALSAEPRKVLPVIPASVPAAIRGPGSASQADEAFAIQLATYVGQQAAQQEVRRLAQKGVRAQVLKQGRYLELRAVGYRSKPAAKAALASLRTMYPDAFLKRVSNE